MVMQLAAAVATVMLMSSTKAKGRRSVEAANEYHRKLGISTARGCTGGCFPTCCLLLKLGNVIFMQEMKRCASSARLDWHTATTLHPGVIDTDLWRYVVRVERLAKMKDGWGLGLLALSAMQMVAKMLEEGALMQGYLAVMSNDVVKGAFYEEMKERGIYRGSIRTTQRQGRYEMRARSFVVFGLI
jgi:hypothetical protein